jgi:integrase
LALSVWVYNDTCGVLSKERLKAGLFATSLLFESIINLRGKLWHEEAAHQLVISGSEAPVPAYKADHTTTIPASEVNDYALALEKPRDKALLAALYLTGARPIELTKAKTGHLASHPDAPNEWFTFTLATAKLGQGQRFKLRERTLELPKNAPLAIHLLTYAQSIPSGANLFPISTSRIRQIIAKATQKKRCPYSFRHSRFTKLARQGASIDEIMYWKGAARVDSVSAYLASKPIGRRLTIE